MVPNSSETPSSGRSTLLAEILPHTQIQFFSSWIGILLLQHTYCECILQLLASGLGLSDFVLLFIYCLLFLKMQLLGLARNCCPFLSSLAWRIPMELEEGVSVADSQCVCVARCCSITSWSQLLVSTRRWAQLIPRPGWGESEVSALGTSPLSPTFFCLLKALYLIRLQNIPVRTKGRMAC